MSTTSHIHRQPYQTYDSQLILLKSLVLTLIILATVFLNSCTTGMMSQVSDDELGGSGWSDGEVEDEAMAHEAEGAIVRGGSSQGLLASSSADQHPSSSMQMVTGMAIVLICSLCGVSCQASRTICY